MIARLAFLALLLLPLSARADQIDAVLKYPSRAAALADLADHVALDGDQLPQFLADRVFPNIKIWRDSQDVIGTASDGFGGTVQTVTHSFLPGFFVLVSAPRIVPALRDDPAIQVVINRDTGTILRSTVTVPVLQDLRFQPVPAGSNYPFGAWR